MKFENIEKEIIYLKAIKQLIDEMVNFEVIKLLGEDPHSEIRFNSMVHQKYLNIMLVDFLSCSDTKILGEQQPYLRALTSICNTSHFNKNNSIKSLSKPTKDWQIRQIAIYQESFRMSTGENFKEVRGK